MRASEAELIRLITQEVLAELAARRAAIPIPIGVSVRHVHLCREHVDQLFGPGYELTARNELYQPGNYAAEETVTLVTPKRTLHNVRILFPLRAQTQVELAYSDAVYLGLHPPIVLSGRSLKGTPGLVLVGPAGAVDLPEGVIIAARHVHMNPLEAARLGVRDGDEIDVAVDGPRALTFRNVVVRVREGQRLEMHLDTDEANATCVTCGVTARMVGLSRQ